MFSWGEELVQNLVRRTRTRTLVTASLVSVFLAVLAPHMENFAERGVFTVTSIGLVVVVAVIYFRSPVRWRSDISASYVAVAAVSLLASLAVLTSSGLPDTWRYPAAASVAICPNLYSLHRTRRRVA